MLGPLWAATTGSGRPAGRPWRSPAPRDAATGAESVLAVVRDEAASRQVWLDPGTGARAGLASGAVAIESSTLTVAWARELAEGFRADGVGFLDAPVVGSRPQAGAGHLVGLAADEVDEVVAKDFGCVAATAQANGAATPVAQAAGKPSARRGG